MHIFDRIAAVTATIVLGASFLSGCGSRTTPTAVVDTPIITVTITEPVTETVVTETFTETLTDEITEAEENGSTVETDANEEETEAETAESASDEGYPVDDDSYVVYHFRTKKQLNEHFEKHGAEFDGDFDYTSAEEYETGASDVINNDDALFKYEKEDGDGVYYIEATNEFVILSKDGFIRTYFRPEKGKKYFDKQ